MKIGIVGPIATENVARFLDTDISLLPRGYAGAPLLGTLITTLIEMGHEVTAYTHDRTLDPAQGPLLVRGTHGFNIYYCACRPHTFLPNGRLPGRMLDFFRVERSALQRAIEADAPEVVHAHWTYEFAMAAIATGIPHVITCHDSPIQVLRYSPNLYRLGRYAMARMVFPQAKTLSAVSPYLRDELMKYAGVEISVIPNPAPLKALERFSGERQPDTRTEKPRIAMLLNGWGRRKNPQPAIKAFALLRRAIPAAALHLYGNDFGMGETAERWATHRQLLEGVVFHGATPHEQLMNDMQQMDVLLHPALEESCPMTLIEAMALGLPVIGGADSGGVPWVLGYGTAGILTDVRNPTAMYQAMLDLLAEPERYQRLSAAARSRSLAEFSPKPVAERYLNLYQQALEVQAPERRML